MQYYRHKAEENLEDMHSSFEQFCLMSGLEKIALMLEQDAEAVADLGVAVQLRGHPALDVHGPHGRLHAQRPQSVPPPGERRSGGFGSGPRQVQRFPALQGADAGDLRGVDGFGPVRPRSRRDPDGRAPPDQRHGDGRGGRDRRWRKQARPRLSRGCGADRRDRAGSAGQPDRSRACDGPGLPVHPGWGEGPEPRGAQHLRRRCGDPAMPGPQGPQRHREAPEGAPRGGEDRAEAGMEHVRPREGAAAPREPGEEVRRHLPRSGEVGPGRHARDADAHPPGAAEVTAQVAGLDEHHGVREHRERERLEERHALAERVDGPAMDRRGHADGPAGLPPRQRPHPPSQAGRRARQNLRGEDGPQVRAGGRRPTERRTGRVAGQAPPESAAGAGFRPGARNAMRAPCRNRSEVRTQAIGIPKCGHRKGTGNA